MESLTWIKAVVSRLLFIAHGICAVYLHYLNTYEMSDWVLVTPLAFIIVEALVTLIYRRGVEFKYVWPSGFLYISCLVPVIWMIELSLLETRISDYQASFVSLKTNETKVERPMTKSQNQQLRGELLIKALMGSNELRKKTCELGLIIVIIIGRWLIPRGTLTRDQLSALLLGYVSNSADILEIFAAFEEPELFDKRPVTIAIMVIFTLSVYQFALVTTSTMESEEDVKKRNRKIHAQNNRVHPAKNWKNLSRTAYIKELKNRRTTSKIAQSKDTTMTLADTSTDSLTEKKSIFAKLRKKKKMISDASEETDTSIKPKVLHGELYQILVTLLMQDGPFFILRTYLIIQYSVASEMHIFFTCKNAIVCILLIYRLLILSCSENENGNDVDQVGAENKLKNIQRAIENMKLRDIEASKMYVS